MLRFHKKKQKEAENKKEESKTDEEESSLSLAAQKKSQRKSPQQVPSSQSLVQVAATRGSEKSSSSLEIVVRAIQDVTFLYQLDKSSNKEASLKRDQFVVLKGVKSIWIRTDNSEYIQILQDGQTFGVFGTGGAKERTFYSKPL